MKNYKYLFTFFLATFLFTSCTEEAIEEPEEEITSGELTTFSIDKNNLFISENANLLIYNTDDYPNVQVSSTNSNVTITKVDELNYTISSSEAGSELITITVFDEKGNQLSALRRLYFYEHGTKDYKTVEGIVIDTDKTPKLISLHGEPEAKSSYTTTGDNPITFEYWYYFSKGFYVGIHQQTETVVFTKLYIGINWTRTIDNIRYTGSLYPHEIDGFNKQNSPEGIVVDDIIKKHGEPDSKNASSSLSSTLKWYQYNDINSAIAGPQYALFHFYSSDINDTNKKIAFIVID